MGTDSRGTSADIVPHGRARDRWEVRRARRDQVRRGPADAASFEAEARQVLEVLAERPGWRAGRVGRAVDDPALWALTSEWDSVGAYRRALGAYDVKVRAVPLLSRAIDEQTHW